MSQAEILVEYFHTHHSENVISHKNVNLQYCHLNTNKYKWDAEFWPLNFGNFIFGQISKRKAQFRTFLRK